MHNEQAVIEVDMLYKAYGDTVAVNYVSLEVMPGEIFGIIGPNGAGKTSLVESMIGLRTADSGHIRVLGLDPNRDRETLAQRIGIQLQQAQLSERMKVWEALDLFSSFYDKTVPWEKLLDEWGLSEKRDAYFTELSGGQKQRLFIALALVNDPEVVFLDELTTGLDPQARRATWELVSAIREQGKTVILVTHYMDEAQALCDRTAVIDNGRVVALDTPQALINQVEADKRVVFTPPLGFENDMVTRLDNVTAVSRENGRVIVHGSGSLLTDVVLTLNEHQLNPADIHTTTADLEDVFIALTGRELRA